MAVPARGRIRIDVTGLVGLSKAFDGTDRLYRQAMRTVITSATEAGRKRIASFVPERTGALAGGLRERYWDAKGDKRPQMASVSTGAGISETGFRYGWALNYGKKIRGKNASGYHYAARGTGNSAARAGQSTQRWISRAVPTMRTTIRRSMTKATRDVELTFAALTRSGR